MGTTVYHSNSMSRLACLLLLSIFAVGGLAADSEARGEQTSDVIDAVARVDDVSQPIGDDEDAERANCLFRGYRFFEFYRYDRSKTAVRLYSPSVIESNVPPTFFPAPPGDGAVLQISDAGAGFFTLGVDNQLPPPSVPGFRYAACTIESAGSRNAICTGADDDGPGPLFTITLRVNWRCQVTGFDGVLTALSEVSSTPAPAFFPVGRISTVACLGGAPCDVPSG